MSIIAQNTDKEVALLDCVRRFFSDHHVGNLLKKCNGTKEKDVPAISLLRYRLGNVFSDPAQLTAIKSWGMDVIAMVKQSSRISL